MLSPVQCTFASFKTNNSIGSIVKAVRVAIQRLNGKTHANRNWQSNAVDCTNEKMKKERSAAHH